MRLWGAGALAIRKESLGARLPVFRERLKCGTNDGDPGIAGYTMFVLGYLGDEPAAKTFLQTKATAGGDMGTIAKAALYLMGDTTQKEAVQAGAKSTSVWVKVACAGALGIVDKDDASVTSIIFPEVKWIEPDNMGVPSSPTDNGMGMYSVHILELVAYHRRGWVYRGNANGPVSFYGETNVATGGVPGTGGTTVPGSGGVIGTGGTSTPVATGGTTGGRDASVGTGGTTATGGAAPSTGGVVPATGGLTGGGVVPPGGQVAGGAPAVYATGGVSSTGGVTGTPSTGGAASPGGDSGPGSGQGSCACRLGGAREVPVLMFPTMVGLALLLVRRRRR
jgi:MYXO-CTERM domain-containing protein